jgi:hypothetical protein
MRLYAMALLSMLSLSISLRPDFTGYYTGIGAVAPETPPFVWYRSTCAWRGGAISLSFTQSCSS